ncbi:FkbM family methyltransferase [Rickettsiella endosymbiont of Rhagonycha lignosa]|uniref:FkbM family methyltransferase n=1 Tax=Rickettsiella endosymbiont of Rhagonycha lignosa TaxID=3077937 RepID=UPI00313F12C3
MSIVNCEKQYKSGEIDIKKYIEEMYILHTKLFEYAKYIENSYISSIEIKESSLILKLEDGINLMYHMPDKRSAAFDLLSFKSYEKEELDVILNIIEPNMVFFDIGANIGWHSINIAKAYESISVYAFEPILETFNLLKNNIILNNLRNVQLFNIGLSNTCEEQVFYYDRHATAFTSSRNNLEKDNIHKIYAQVEKMDEFICNNKIDKVDFIKCDVEGSELHVIQGGKKHIEKFLPMVMIEMVRKWTANFHYHPNQIIKFFADLEYQCFRIQDKKLIDFPFMDEETPDINFLFLHKIKHANKIKNYS